MAPEYIEMREHGDDAREASGYTAMQRLLALAAPPDGVFCYNDPTAMGAMKAVLETGLRVPEDVALAGCGNVAYADFLRVPLTSVDQPSAVAILPWMDPAEAPEVGAILDFAGLEGFCKAVMGPDQLTARREFLASMLTADIPPADFGHAGQLITRALAAARTALATRTPNLSAAGAS